MPFWSGPKRAPSPIDFDLNNVRQSPPACDCPPANGNFLQPLHMQYVVAAANIRAFNYGLKGSEDLNLFRKVLSNVIVPDFKPKSGLAIQTKDDEPVENADDENTTAADIMATLPSASSLAGYRMIPAEFEKDDDTNHHIDVSPLFFSAYMTFECTLAHALIQLSVHHGRVKSSRSQLLNTACRQTQDKANCRQDHTCYCNDDLFSYRSCMSRALQGEPSS